MAKAKKIYDYNSKFAVRFRELMSEKKMTQEELAAVLKVTRQSVSNYSNGLYPPSETLLDIAKEFEVSADYLLGLSDIKSVNADLQSAAAYLGVSENAVNGLKEEFDDIKSEGDGTEGELMLILDKVLSFKENILGSIVEGISRIISNKDLLTYTSSELIKNEGAVPSYIELVEADESYYEFVTYKMIFKLCSEIAKDIGTFYTEEEIEKINNAKTKEELIAIADNVTSPTLKEALTNFNDMFKYEIFKQEYTNKYENTISDIFKIFTKVGDTDG